jgi:hypothetical protein
MELDMFNLNEYFSNPNNFQIHREDFYMFKRIICADGLTFSAQARDSAYCTPRQNKGPWTAVEVGFPSESVDEFMQYAENADDPTGTVYGWVPVEVVEQVVEKHGGLMLQESKEAKITELNKQIKELQSKVKELS